MSHLVTNFAKVYGAEYADIRNAAPAVRQPTTQDKMTGLALSGGGIRSASFGLGVLQAKPDRLGGAEIRKRRLERLGI